MKVEIWIVIFWITLLIIWATWVRATTWYHNRRYKPENDKGRLAEDERNRLIAEEFANKRTDRGKLGKDGTRSSPTEARERDSERHDQPSERSILSPATSDRIATDKVRSSRLKRILKGRK